MLLLVVAPARGQEPAPRDVQVYKYVYFERFAPQTARNMLAQVPGFSVRSTGGGRGLGQGGANVLINGERVTSKDADVFTILARTPATTVIQIEVADAAALGVTGLTGQVANVVIDRSSLAGSWEWNGEFRNGAQPRLTNAAGSLSGQRGIITYTLGFENDSFRGFEEGPEQLLLPDGSLLEERFEKQGTQGENPSVTTVLDFDIGPRTDLSVTAAGALNQFQRRETSFREDGSLRRSVNEEDEWNALLSTELSRDIGSGSLKLIGYQRFEHSPFVDSVETATFDATQALQTFRRDIDEGESIGRAEYAWATSDGVTWELAGEAAFNFLEQAATLTEGIGADAVTQPFPRTRVEEIRSQLSLTRGFTIGDDLAVQASAAGEWSRITVLAEESSSNRDFIRPRGFVTVAYPWSESLNLRARLERSVGQLRFSDFVSSINLREEREQAGNQDLVPQQSWDGEIEVQKSFTDDEKVIIRTGVSLISDRVDRVLIDGADAVGNIDEARLYTFGVEGTLLTNRLGLEGGRLDFGYDRQSSEIDDPLTGERRPFSGVPDWQYNATFRHDVPLTPYAWGAAIDDRDDTRTVRFNEIVRFSLSGPALSAFFEHKDLFGTNLRFEMTNLSNRDYDLIRTRYAGLRDVAPIEVVESRSRIDNHRFRISVSGNF